MKGSVGMKGIFVTGTNTEVGNALQDIITEGVDHLSKYLKKRIEKGELKSDIPLKTSASLFLFPIMIFFLQNHRLSDSKWEKAKSKFTKELFLLWSEGSYK